ncbi:MAG TPA: chemotaxis protein CheB [Chloroflexia bacterium]|nr:chemotaxis protein CheB [Chloroflexia bacterium]
MPPLPDLNPAPFPLVAVGVSLGGLTALRELLGGLPAGFPAALVVVQHLSPRYSSQFPLLLQRGTPLAVQWAEPDQPVEAGRVYIAPPDYHVVVTPAGCLALHQGPPVAYTRPAVTPLFESVAASYGPHGIGVVLTGGGSDGAAGVKAIKAAGGRVLVQDPRTALAASMPESAIRTGSVDFVLPLTYIAPALITLVMRRGADSLFWVPPRPAGGWPAAQPAAMREL